MPRQTFHSFIRDSFILERLFRVYSEGLPTPARPNKQRCKFVYNFGRTDTGEISNFYDNFLIKKSEIGKCRQLQVTPGPGALSLNPIVGSAPKPNYMIWPSPS